MGRYNLDYVTEKNKNILTNATEESYFSDVHLSCSEYSFATIVPGDSPVSGGVFDRNGMFIPRTSHCDNDGAPLYPSKLFDS